MPLLLRDKLHTVLGAQSIGCSLLGVGIVLPHSVGIESVFVTTRGKRHAEPPEAVRTFLHRSGPGIPVIEVAGQRYLPDSRGLEGELSRIAGELFVLR